MDIDKLKNEIGGLRAPENFTLAKGGEEDQTIKFIARLKKADLNSKKKLKGFYIIYFFIAAFYFGLFILNPDQDLKLNDRINGTLLFIGILLFAILGKIKYSELRKTRYDQPTQKFLLNALHRHKFWPREMNYTLLIVILINVGSCRSFVYNYPIVEKMILDIIAFQLVFFIVMSIGFYFGYQYWKKHKKPMYKEIKYLLNENE